MSYKYFYSFLFVCALDIFFGFSFFTLRTFLFLSVVSRNGRHIAEEYSRSRQWQLLYEEKKNTFHSLLTATLYMALILFSSKR